MAVIEARRSHGIWDWRRCLRSRRHVRLRPDPSRLPSPVLFIIIHHSGLDRRRGRPTTASSIRDQSLGQAA